MSNGEQSGSMGSESGQEAQLIRTPACRLVNKDYDAPQLLQNPSALGITEMAQRITIFSIIEQIIHLHSTGQSDESEKEREVQ
jgi:hypothetical protein